MKNITDTHAILIGLVSSAISLGLLLSLAYLIGEMMG